MNRLSMAAVASAALVAAAVLPLSGVGWADAHPANLVSATVAPAGAKKATVSWNAISDSDLTGSFDAYYVTLDNDDFVAPFQVDRSRFVDKADPLTVTFGDLNAGTNYFAYVYAIDYTNSGIDIIEPNVDPTDDTAIGFSTGIGGTLTINGPTSDVLGGTAVNLSGSLTQVGGGAAANANIKVEYNPYPSTDNTWLSSTVQTNGSGAWTFSQTPSTNTIYRASWATPTSGSDGYVGAWTRNLSVDVRRKIAATVAPGRKFNAGTKLTFSGKFPVVSGFPSYYQSGVTFDVQKLTAGSWVTVGGTIKTLDAAGNYSVAWTPAASADGKYRVFSGLGSAYADSYSKAFKIVIH